MKEIALTQGKVALVDDEDFERVSQFKWCASWHSRQRVYTAVRRNCGTNVLMHRFILQPPSMMHIDHINHDTLDNRRANLRVCTNAENHRNQRKTPGTSSQYKGVSWDRRKQKWRAQIRKDYKQQWLGYFADEDEAARAYNVAAQEHFGRFALLNEELT